MRRLNILFVATELRGVVAIGGLAEVVMALSYALKKAGHEVRIAMPFYKCSEFDGDTKNCPTPVWQGDLQIGSLPPAEIFETSISFKDESIRESHYNLSKTTNCHYAS